MLNDLDLTDEPVAVRQLLQNPKLDHVAGVIAKDLARALEVAWQTSSHDIVNELFSACVSYLKASPTGHHELMSVLIDFLNFAPAMVVHFVRLSPWKDLVSVSHELNSHVHAMLRALVLCADRMGQLAMDYLVTLLGEVRQLSITELYTLIELVALTVSTTETALNILVEQLEPTTSRIVLLPPKTSQYLVNGLSAIAINHIEEAVDTASDSRASSYKWKFVQAVVRSREEFLLTCNYRIDAPLKMRLSVGDHLRFFCVQCPDVVLISQVPAFEALVEKSEVGRITLKCMRHPPAIYQHCLWQLEPHGSFVTAQTTMNAMTKLILEKEGCCKVYAHLMAKASVSRVAAKPTTDISHLNISQQSAVVEAIQRSVTCIWGPPGTGKIQTIVTIIHELLASDPEKRLLVTAPTHNAVDNVLRRCLKSELKHVPVRVSTDVRKVSTDLRAYTCDAMLGKDLNQNLAARRKAQKQISQARLVFTTCVGAGLGLLRSEIFDNVIIDEASQQTEPASLVPIVKGCSRLVLVGDHVQLRATVQPRAAALGFDMSLFEPLWKADNAVGKVMLNTQYRMHPSICMFPSNEFYEGQLQSAAHCERIAVPSSVFAWPEGRRMVFVQSSTMEDLGRKSKSNSGQAKVCQMIMSQLRETTGSGDYSVAILTPYTRQVEQLQQMLPGETISSIHGFQGQEADVVVYVSVRCNLHGEIGFLKDMRRLNVALTRARAGVIIIGDHATLTGKNKNRGQDEEVCYATWKRLLETCSKVDIAAG